ncbi:MAG TPA: hypothetical protein VMZ22_05540 [Acidimicrobiales bacterium]|nr:hypothetical protein [Acidimicrobiales bacterium]
MDSWKDMTLGDIARGFTRYRPFILAVAAMLLVLVAFPSADRKSGTGDGATALSVGESNAVDGDAPAGEAGDAIGDVSGDAASDAAAAERGIRGATSGPTLTTLSPAAMGPDCDPVTNRVRMPIRSAPPCLVSFSGNNGGATAQGVTAKEIKVVFYQPTVEAAVAAALTAAGASNTEAEQESTMRDYVDLMSKHVQMYGRHIVIEVKHGSGKSDDDAAGRADAVDIGTRIKPFAVFGAPATNAFADELAARKILCICTTSQPQEFYESHAPYIGYTSLMASTQGYIHRAEYLAKRLNGRNATHSGDAVMRTQKRTFGLLYYDTPDHGYRTGANFFVKHLREKYGLALKVIQEYPNDYPAVQEQARSYIQKLKDAGVTSVLCACDPIAPALITKEATKQRYFPEWIITGSALTDTTLFGRTYDPAQWRNAFGISFLTARVPETQGDAWRVYKWHFPDKDPAANNQYGVIYPAPLTLALGITMAGPNLTVQNWQKGLFSMPVSNAGLISAAQSSFGSKGIWPFTDYLALDDVTEIFWDPEPVGEDEVGNVAAGMYRYVAGGKRYLPGAHPSSDPNVFNNEGAPTVYAQSPDKPVENYEHKHYYAGQ